MKHAFVLITILIAPSVGLAATIHVPWEFQTIQSAVEAAKEGCTIVVAPGVYVENLDFKGKSITVKSSHGPEVTVIDGGQPRDPDYGSVVTFQSGEGLLSRLEGFTITNGTGSMGWGGGIYCSGASPTITNNIIRENSVGNKWFGGLGGGIFCHDSSAVITGNTITRNYSHFGGGGISCWYTSTSSSGPQAQYLEPSWTACDSKLKKMKGVQQGPLISNNVISLNGSDKKGGGIDLLASAPHIEDNIITKNRASNGGGIFCDLSQPTLSGNLIEENRAVLQGGGVFCVASSPFLSANTLRANTAYQGGGIACSDSQALLTNNALFENRASSFGMTAAGGGIACMESTLIALHNTLLGNHSDGMGGAMSLSGSSALVTNTILWSNYAPFGSEIRAESGSVLTISHSNVLHGQEGVSLQPGNLLEWGQGMMDDDPQFVEPGAGDIHLRGTSPCVDAGDGAAQGLPVEDYEGDPRPAEGPVDMGCDEFHPHLYCMEGAAAGKKVELKLIAPPRAALNGVFLGAGILDPPLPTQYGDLYLQSPVILIAFVPTMPPEGFVVFSGIPPYMPPGPYLLPMQALVAGGELTNLCPISVD